MKYAARAYYRQNISFPHSFTELPFSSKQTGLAWAKASPNCFLAEVWQNGTLLLQQSRYFGKTWKHHAIEQE